MSAYEVMLSESQERMLLVAERGREDEVARASSRSGTCTPRPIGTVTADERLRVFNDGALEADVPNECAHRRGAGLRPALGRARNPAAEEDVLDARAARRPRRQRCSRVLASPNVASKRWIYRAVRLHGAHEHRRGPGRRTRPWSASRARKKALAMSLDGNGRYCWLDPFEGARAGRRRGLPQRRRLRRACRSAPPTA